MSTIDRPVIRGAKRPAWLVSRVHSNAVPIESEDSRPRSTPSRWRQDRAIGWATFAGVSAFAISWFAFMAWVHYNCEGVSHRAFLPGRVFGLTAAERQCGFEPVAPVGFDGQSYYRQSNDVFARRDAAEHIDNPMYRYQRIGVPMMAGGLATLLGYSTTPPLLYHGIQFAWVGLGFGVLVFWLLRNNLSPWYALGWLLSPGVIEASWRGLPDAVGDVFFMLTFFALLKQRLAWYAVLSTVLCLVREGYLAYSLVVFLLTACNRLEWPNAQRWIQRVAATAAPGAISLLWAGYLTWQLRMSPFVARNNPDAKSWPFEAFFRCMKIFYRQGNWFKFRLAIVSMLTFVLVSWFMVRNHRKLPVALLCVGLYMLVTAALGKMVWEAYAGHVKAMGSIVLVGIFMLPTERSVLLRFALALQVIAGVGLQGQVLWAAPQLLSPALGAFDDPPKSTAAMPENPLLNDLRSDVKWIDPEAVCHGRYRGPLAFAHRELKPIRVAVTNLTDCAWLPGGVRHPIQLGYELFDGKNRFIGYQRVTIDQPIAANETKEFIVYLELRQPNKNYSVEISLFQDGPGWFCRNDAAFGARYQFRVE